MRPTLRAELIRHALGSFVLKSVGALLQLAAAIILARALGPDGYGVYGFAFAVVTLLSVPATAGLPQLIVRTVAQYDAEMRYRLMRGLLIRASQLVTILSVLLSGFAVTAYYCFGRVDLTSSAGRTYLIAMLLIPLVALSHVRMAALRGLRKVLLGLVPDVVVRWSLFVTVIYSRA